MSSAGTIVVIEDEEDLRVLLCHFLEEQNFVVLSAADGASGLMLSRQFRPDLILCDIKMPGLDGYEVLRDMRADPEMAGTAFLFLTAKGDSEDFRTGMNLGADDYLYKPIRLRVLLAAIQARLARRNEQRAAANQPSSLASLGLSPRECEVLFWVAQGKTNPEIAIILNIGRSTVKTHLQNILSKTGTPNRLGAASVALAQLGGRSREPFLPFKPEQDGINRTDPEE